jgi:hypothetical protein
MKNLFIISEEEKKRILGLHESATKRQYLKEAKVEGDQFKGRTIQFGNTENSAKILFNLLISMTKDGRIVGARTNVDETEFVTSVINLIKSPDALNRVNGQLVNIMTQIGQPNYAGLDKIFNDILDYNAGDKDDIERLITHLQALGYTKDQAAKLKSANFVLSPLTQQKQTTPQSSGGASQFKMSAGEKEYREKLAKGEIDKQGNKIKKTGGVGDASVSPCPVGKGTTQEVTDFQNYVVNDVKDTTILGKYGPNKNGVDGKCGNSTRRAWTKYGELYNKYKGDENQGTGAVVPDNTNTQSKQSTPVNATRGGSGMGQTYFDDLKNSGGNATPAASSGGSTKPASSGGSVTPSVNTNSPVGKESELDDSKAFG